MSITLEKITNIGDVSVLAIAETHVAAERTGRGIGGSCVKAPVAIVFQRGADIVGIDAEFARLDRSALERRFPDAVAALNERG